MMIGNRHILDLIKQTFLQPADLGFRHHLCGPDDGG